MDHKVYLAFGFHVNCYHSYRGDTNDKAGFGNDIKIIRNTIKKLDRYNSEGIKVQGTWDFENAYSLDKILPQYAPDIIEDVRRRQKENGDENILMGYNNGALTGHTEAEFKAAITWAVTNKYHSGLKDLFGDCQMVIRPQEVMFSPEDVCLYEKCGVKTVCLYYSTNPFDAFHSLVPPLDDQAKYNPLSYSYQGHHIQILPTYSQLDLMDEGSLRHLIFSLHLKQMKGEINSDLLIFINIDADSLLWEKLPLPSFLQKKPNFGGLEGLVEEVKDLPFVTFTTPGKYLKDHAPVKEIFFGEDVADGNFTGYSSWAEKPFNRLIWTRLERGRSYSRLYEKEEESPSFEPRVNLLSTTHFGLASPVLNIAREKKALELSSSLIEAETNALKKSKNIVVIKKNHSALSLFQLQAKKGSVKKIEQIEVEGEGLEDSLLIPQSRYEDDSIQSFLLLGKFSKGKDRYELTFKLDANKPSLKKEKGYLNNLISYDEKTKSLAIRKDKGHEARLLLSSSLTYKGEQINFSSPQEKELPLNGKGEALSFFGEINIPHALKQGSYELSFISSPFLKGIILLSKINYPYTEERDRISSSASNLGRYTDNSWIEAKPLEMMMLVDKKAEIRKRNFRSQISSYPLSDFFDSDKKNSSIDSFNHHLTGGLIEVKDGEDYFNLGSLRTFEGSLAHCPMRLRETDRENFALLLNPFGTYFGKQRHYISHGNGSVMDIYTYLAPQSQSLAPSYNGAEEAECQFFAFASGKEEEEIEKEFSSLADGDVIMPSSGEISPFTADNVSFYRPLKVTEHPRKNTSMALHHPFKIISLVLAYFRNTNKALRKLKKEEKEYKSLVSGTK
jgi:hypothetical protein